MPIAIRGQITPFEGGWAAYADVAGLSADKATAMAAAEEAASPFAPAMADGKTPYIFLFEELQEDASNLLPGLPGTEEGLQTEKALESLGATMFEPVDHIAIPDSKIPAAYTYFGQFVDHDITSEKVIGGVPLNQRTPRLDLDSVYGAGSVREKDSMRLEPVRSAGLGLIQNEDDGYDLPRGELPENSRGRRALIPEPRNDENLIIAQLHVAFLRAHNNAVKQLGLDFKAASTLIRQHYQCIVLNDFLKKIAAPDIVDKTKQKNEFFFPKDPLCMPMEFSLAAFRFGHSMVRAGYNRFNVRDNVPISATLDMLFTFTGFGGFMGSYALPENWVIDWKSFMDVFNFARRIDTTLVKPLFRIPTQHLDDLGGEGRLSVRNLLRGYRRKLPTGQAVAARMKIPALTEKQIEAVAQEVSTEKCDQLAAVKQSQFTTRTPLWYYILAEAAHYRKEHPERDCLGPVGSTLVAEVLIGILRRSEDSILGPEYTKDKPWRPHPSISTEAECNLPDFLKFAGVLS